MADSPVIDPPKREDALAVAKALTEVSAAFVAFTFVGGWSYLASYYRTFGLNPLELDISTSVVSTIALYVLYKPLWPLIVFAGLVAILALVARRQHRLERGWIVAALIFSLLVVIVAGANHGRSVADQDMQVESNSLPNVAFAARDNIDQLPCVEVGTFGSHDCKLLLHAKSVYYFFLPIPGTGQGSLNLYMLPDAEVASVHVLRGLDRNAR